MTLQKQKRGKQAAGGKSSIEPCMEPIYPLGQKQEQIRVRGWKRIAKPFPWAQPGADLKLEREVVHHLHHHRKDGRLI